MCRATAFGTWLVCCSGAGLVREFNPRTTAQVAQWKIGELAFDAYRKANGNTVVSHLSAISEFSPAGRVVRRFACADHPDLKLGNLCGVQDRPNGNLVVGTYRNGSQDGTRTTAFELTPEGKVVWRFASTNDVTMMTVWMVDEARAGGDVRAAREQMRVFSAAAARRFLADMKGNAKYDYAKYAPAIEALIEKEQAVRAALGGSQLAATETGGSRSCATETGGSRSCATEKVADAQERVPPVQEAVRMVEAYRQAMLANPVLDFDEILCVRRKVAEPRRATYPQQLLGDYDFGFTGLNAQTTWTSTGRATRTTSCSSRAGRPARPRRAACTVRPTPASYATSTSTSTPPASSSPATAARTSSSACTKFRSCRRLPKWPFGPK